MAKTLYFANWHALCKVMSRSKTPPRINVTPVRLMLLEISSLWNWYKVEQSLPTGGFFGSLTIHKQDREKINIAGWNGGESEYKLGRDGTKLSPFIQHAKITLAHNDVWKAISGAGIFSFLSETIFLDSCADDSIFRKKIAGNIFFWNYYPLRLGRRPKIWGVFNLEFFFKSLKKYAWRTNWLAFLKMSKFFYRSEN